MNIYELASEITKGLTGLAEITRVENNELIDKLQTAIINWEKEFAYKIISSYKFFQIDLIHRINEPSLINENCFNNDLFKFIDFIDEKLQSDNVKSSEQLEQCYTRIRYYFFSLLLLLKTLNNKAENSDFIKYKNYLPRFTLEELTREEGCICGFMIGQFAKFFNNYLESHSYLITSLDHINIQFVETELEAWLKPGDISIPIEKNSNQYHLCKKMFSKDIVIGTPVDWEDIYYEIEGIAEPKDKEWKTINNAVHGVNQKIKEALKINLDLFTYSNNQVTRNS